MNRLQLTKSLIYHRAAIVDTENECPEGYIEVAGYVGPGLEISIALPENLFKSRKVFKRLTLEAEECLMKAYAPKT
jgi:hypothetical protein